MKNRNVSLYANLFLVSGIGFLCFYIYFKRSVSVEYYVVYNKPCYELKKYLFGSFGEITRNNGETAKTKYTLLNILNNPSIENYDNISTLYSKYYNDLQVIVLARDKGGFDVQGVRYKNRPRNFIITHYDNRTFNNNYYLFIKDEKIIYVNDLTNIFDSNVVIRSLLGKYDIKNEGVSGEIIKNRILESLKGKDKYWFLNNNEYVNSASLLKYNQIIFINSDCTLCEIKSAISSTDIEKTDIYNTALLFSVYGYSRKMIEYIDKKQISVHIFMDAKDNLNILSADINLKQLDHIKINVHG